MDFSCLDGFGHGDRRENRGQPFCDHRFTGTGRPDHEIDRVHFAAMLPRMKATAYVRWSSDEQTDGHSLQRQTKNVQVYADRVGLTISETLVDEGFSAFKGDHISKGKLGRFLVDVDKGRHRGTALIVEHLDRLDRRGIEETRTLLARIINSGVEIHVAQENRVIRDTNDFISALLNLVGSHSATEFSRKLQERVSDAWRKKKHNGANGVSISRKLPGWLKGRVGEPIAVNEERAKVVVRIFEMTASGVGRRLIAKRLNEEKVPTFSGAGGPKLKREPRWIDSYIHKILTNRAVLGEYQPRKRGGEADGEVRVDFYPAIVAPDLWQRAQSSALSRKTSTGFYGRTGKIRNLFSGLLFDAGNGRSLHFIDKGKRERPKLVVDYDGDRRAIVYADFEKSFLQFLDIIDWTEVLDVAESTELLQAEEKIGRLRLEIERAGQTVEKLANLLLDTPSPTLKQKLLATEQKIEADKLLLSSAQERLASLKQRNHDLLDDSVIWSKLAEATDIPTRTRLREEIRRKVKRVSVDFSGLRLPQIGEVKCVASVEFVNGASRALVFASNIVYLSNRPVTKKTKPETMRLVRASK
jgi:DNA invertase Pin-like site-specific DNA recombinase